MEDKTMNTETFKHPEGVEVKLSGKSINIRGIIWMLVLFIIGSNLFVYIWEDFSIFNVGYQLGHIFSHRWISLSIILYFTGYTFLQAGIIYWMSGKKLKSLRWHFDWTSAGFYPAHPIALKYYRVFLLLPAIVLGLLPTIHGFCTGSSTFFYLGLFGLVTGSADITFWYKLRTFDDEDLLLAGKKGFQATIIKRNYGKSS